MIPFFQLPAWGLLVGVGIIVGTIMADLRAKQLGLPRRSMSSAITWAVLGAASLSHVFSVIAYSTNEFLATPWMAIDPRFGWSVSSFGGFFGAAVSLWCWSRRNGRPMLPFADALVFGLVPAWIFGRLGCFSVHDHVGVRTDFFLGVQFPGGARHDMALYEVLLAVALTTWFVRSLRSRLPAGAYVARACLVYAPVRFVLDFFRATDLPHAEPRWLGLTPGHYSAVVVLAFGIVIALRLRDGARATWRTAASVA